MTTRHKAFRITLTSGLLAVAVGVPAIGVRAQQRGRGPADHPSVTVNGQAYTPASILARNMGSTEDQETQFPPHKIAGNVYYVGTKTLSSFLIVTPAGNILVDSTYERNVPVIQKSVEQLGFKFSDIKILLGNHAHGDHMEGDAMVKQLTGAQVMAMAADVPALQAMKPGGKEHPDRQGSARWRIGLSRRDDARRAPDRGAHPRRHDVDDQGPGRRKDLRRRVLLQLTRGRRDYAGDRSGARPLVCRGARVAL